MRSESRYLSLREILNRMYESSLTAPLKLLTVSTDREFSLGITCDPDFDDLVRVRVQKINEVRQYLHTMDTLSFRMEVIRSFNGAHALVENMSYELEGLAKAKFLVNHSFKYVVSMYYDFLPIVTKST